VHSTLGLPIFAHIVPVDFDKDRLTLWNASLIRGWCTNISAVVAFLREDFVAKEEVGQAQEPSALLEAPFVDGMQTLARLVELDNDWREEVVEEEIERKL
jgi:hypothetical protein